MLVAYDHQKPAAGADAATVMTGAGLARIGLNVVGLLHRQEHVVEVLGELGVIARDLVVPAPREQRDRAALGIAHIGQVRLVAGHGEPG